MMDIAIMVQGDMIMDINKYLFEIEKYEIF